VIEDIRSGLKERGYESDTGVGKSGFKVDIGVRREGEESYCLGILIDGSGDIRYSTSTTREISQPSVLKGLGWKVIRVWSLDWWENKDAVIDECIAAIDSIETPAPEPAPQAEPQPEPAPEPAAQPEADTQKKTELVTYKTAELTLPVLTAAQFADAQNISLLTDAVRKVINTEAPISTELLQQRLCDACGNTRKTAAVKDRVDYILKSLKYNVTLQNNTLNKDPKCDRHFIWKEPGEAWRVMETYRVPEEGTPPRKADEIPVEEAACAVVTVCRAQYGLPREALLTEAGRALGFTVVSPAVKNLCEQAADLAINAGLLTEGESMIKHS
jgi:hypothetical protein